MPDTSKHIWRTPKTAQSPYSYQLWCYSTNKWQNETGSVEGLARRPVGKVNRPSDLKSVSVAPGSTSGLRKFVN